MSKKLGKVSKKGSKNKKHVEETAVVTKPTSEKKGKTVDKEKMAKRKAEKKAKRDRTEIKPPASIPKAVGGVVNPIVEFPRLKRALVCALALVEDNDDKLANLVRESGIPFRQTVGKDVKDPTTLTKGEWSGRIYGGYGRKETTGDAKADIYVNKHKEKVDSCMEFAKALKKSMK